MRRIATYLATIAVGALLLIAQTADAGDWPQILGPDRNGIAHNESIAGKWRASGPPTVWERPVGSGFSGVAVADGIAVLFHRVGDQERVEAMNADNGDVIWTANFPARYVPSYTNDNGPRAVPIIHSGRIYVYGARGNLHCLELKDGTKHWSRDTFDDYNSKRPFRGEPPEGYFGIGSTPIIEGKIILVNVGGDTKGAGIVAFSLATGKTVWKSTRERASYSSPLTATINGKRHVIFITRLNVVSVDPATGSEHFRFPFGAPGPKVSAATPLVFGDRLFVSASYGFGAAYARVSSDGADVLWQSDEIMSSQYTTCIEHQKRLFGIHGRQDAGYAALRCFDPKTEKILWDEEGFGYATLIKAGDKLLALKTDGELVLLEANLKQYRELARASLFSSTTRALPALANGRLYARDTKTLKCLDLR